MVKKAAFLLVLFVILGYSVWFINSKIKLISNKALRDYRELRTKMLDNNVSIAKKVHVKVPENLIKHSSPLYVNVFNDSSLFELKEDEWDGFAMSEPLVLRIKDKYLMYYEGAIPKSWKHYDIGHPSKEHGARWEIGLATSPDGKKWKKMKEPVLKREFHWESHHVYEPSVMYDEEAGKYKMWYTAGSEEQVSHLGYAYSKDGISWEKYPFPIMSPQKVYESSIQEPSIIKYKGAFIGHFTKRLKIPVSVLAVEKDLYYDTTATMISRFTSSNGLDWTNGEFIYVASGGFQGKVYKDRYLVYVIETGQVYQDVVKTDNTHYLMGASVGIRDLEKDYLIGLYPVVVADSPNGAKRDYGYASECDILIEKDKLILWNPCKRTKEKVGDFQSR